MAATGHSKADIVLNSPVGAEPAVYKWPLASAARGSGRDEAEEIVETMRWVGREFPEFKPAIENLVPGQSGPKSYEWLKSLCDKYNKILETVLKMNKGTSVAPKTSSRASQGLLRHILRQARNHATPESSELGRSSPSAADLQTEANFALVAQLVERNHFRPREKDTFVELASGLGQRVMQMAALVECKKCFGIERSAATAARARLMEQRFRFWMRWHGKSHSDFELHQGDFFDKKSAEMLRRGAYILVATGALEPETELKLGRRFLELRNGVQILAPKALCSPATEVGERQAGESESSLHFVSEVRPELRRDGDAGATTAPFYLHVLSTSAAAKKQERKRRPQDKPGEPSPVKKRHKAAPAASASPASPATPAVAPGDLGERLVFGPTTRKAWSEWVNMAGTGSRTAQAGHRQAESASDKTSARAGKPSESGPPRPLPRKRDKRTPETAKAGGGGGDEKQLGAASQTTGAATARVGQAAAKSCLDKKRDYASKRSKPDGQAKVILAAKATPLVQKTASAVEARAGVDASRVELGVGAKLKAPVNDENSKKLRQRKKQAPAPAVAQTSIAQTPTPGTPKRGSSKAAPRAPSSATAAPLVAATRRPSQMGPAAATATKVEEVKGSPGGTKRRATSSSGQRADARRAKGVAGTSGDGFVSGLRSRETAERLLEGVRGSIELFARRLEKADVRESLGREIERERQTKLLLALREQELLRETRVLNERLFRVFKRHSDELGIQNNVKSLVGALCGQLRRNQELRWRAAELGAAVGGLRAANPLPAPQPAHANSSQRAASPFRRGSAASATLDLSLKQAP